jgi:hypothetical protein
MGLFLQRRLKDYVARLSALTLRPRSKISLRRRGDAKNKKAFNKYLNQLSPGCFYKAGDLGTIVFSINFRPWWQAIKRRRCQRLPHSEDARILYVT